jgi:hypothetical protein
MRNFFEAIQRSGHAGMVVGIWVVALFAAIGAVYQGRIAVEAYSAVTQIERIRVPEIKVASMPLGKNDYENVADVVSRLHPGIEARGEAGGVVIISRTIGNFDGWRLAVLDAIQIIDGAIWKPDLLCVGSKCPEPYKIKLSAFRAKVQATGGVAMKK